MTEADLQTKFSRWLRHYVNFPIAYELKISKSNRLPFNRLLDHQRVALQKAKHGTLCYKIPDSGMALKPFDGFCLTQVPSMVGIMFYTARGENRIYMVDIDDFVYESTLSASITRERASAIAWRTIELGVVPQLDLVSEV